MTIQVRIPSDGPPGPLSRLWRWYLDLAGWKQIALVVVALLIVGEIVNLSRPKAEANPHDVAVCNGIDRMNAVNIQDPNAGPTIARIIDEMESEADGASPEIGSAVREFAAVRQRITGLGERATTQDRTDFQEGLQSIADACTELEVPHT